MITINLNDHLIYLESEKNSSPFVSVVELSNLDDLAFSGLMLLSLISLFVSLSSVVVE